ncbi:DCP2-domain-containing protein [Phycomyces blakesleeanus]|uniref:DCP2-domain-containing protein n=1 Tax=Phycomyces blakesleeanus TaxID=4837 RepID=A0ABR3AQW7_PHYBL
MALQSGVVLANATFEEILDDLSRQTTSHAVGRFIINVPDVELKSVERICFQVEQAHWFYEDFHCPLLRQWAHEHERAYADFMQYRFRIPVCGAIMINAALDKCVLVKGWSSKSGWGFPKGKINQDEEYDCCAIREVYDISPVERLVLEETGYDVEPLLKQQDYIELTMREQRIRLYLIVGVPEDTDFVPRTRKEISEIAWFKFDELPTYKAINNVPEAHIRTGGYRFYMVVPFVRSENLLGSYKRLTLDIAS